MKFIKDIVTHDQLEVPEFVSLLLHMTYIVLTYKIVVDLLFKVNCHINMFIMSINSVLWRLSIIKVIYGGGGWSHWRVVQVCFPYCSSYYSKFTSFLEFHTSKEEVGDITLLIDKLFLLVCYLSKCLLICWYNLMCILAGIGY